MDENNVTITKRSHAFKDYASSYNVKTLSQEQKQLLMQVSVTMYLNQSILQLYQTYRSHGKGSL